MLPLNYNRTVEEFCPLNLHPDSISFEHFSLSCYFCNATTFSLFIGQVQQKCWQWLRWARAALTLISLTQRKMTGASCPRSTMTGFSLHGFHPLMTQSRLPVTNRLLAGLKSITDTPCSHIHTRSHWITSTDLQHRPLLFSPPPPIHQSCSIHCKPAASSAMGSWTKPKAKRIFVHCELQKCLWWQKITVAND